MPAMKAGEDSWLARCGFPACRETTGVLAGESPQGKQEQSEWLPGAWLGAHGTVSGPDPIGSAPMQSAGSCGPAIDATVVSTTTATPIKARIILEGRFMSRQSRHYSPPYFPSAKESCNSQIAGVAPLTVSRDSHSYRHAYARSICSCYRLLKAGDARLRSFCVMPWRTDR